MADPSKTHVQVHSYTSSYNHRNGGNSLFSGKLGLKTVNNKILCIAIEPLHRNIPTDEMKNEIPEGSTTVKDTFENNGGLASHMTITRRVR